MPSRATKRGVRSPVVVVGATGKTGREVARRLAARGVPVRALVRDRARAEDLAAAGLEIVVADLAKPETLPRALDGASKAYLMTAADPQQVTLHGNFIREAKRAGVEHIVRHSVRGADPGSPAKLARWHAASESDLEASGIAWTHLQPVYNMQNFLRFIPTIGTRSAFYAPMSEGAVSMVDARDIAAVAAAALTGEGHEGKRYVVTGPEALTFADAARHLSTVLGRPIRYVDLAPGDARRAMVEMGLAEWYVSDLLALYAFYCTGAGAVVSDVVPTVAGQPARTFLQFARHYSPQFTTTAH
jgi:uncharacterized protein YbjT (DUF2867 family)